MAIKYAIQDGNWSDASTWNDNIIPTEGDDVYANGFKVTVLEDINVNLISTKECPETGNSGGQFYTPNNRTFVCDVHAGTSHCIVSNNYQSYTIIGNVYGSEYLNTYAVVTKSANGNFPFIKVIGNIVSYNSFALYINCQNVYAFQNYIVIGNVTSVNSPAFNKQTINTAIGTSLNIVGIVTSINSPVISATELWLTGIVYSNNTPAIIGMTSDSIAYVSGQIFNNLTTVGIVGFYNMMLQSDNHMVWRYFNENQEEQILYSSNFANYPSENDVRKDVQYGAIQEYTGEMVVPIEGHVIQGVEYDINKIGQLPVAQTINSQDVTDIMSNIANIEIKIDNVDDKIDTIDTSINTVNNNISNMNIDINTIENELDTAITNINTIDGKVDVIDGKIDTLPTDTLNELKQDDLGERLSKVGTIEEMTNIIINS